MTFKLVDRVRETCISPGTATVALIGAALGYQTFSAGIGANNTTYYVIADQSGANWEVGYGTVGALGTTLARTTVLSSSNGGSLVNFTSGTQDVWVDYPATKAVFQDSTGTVSVPVLLTTSTTSTTPNLAFNASNTGLSAGASISGSYLQAILQNKSGTAGASANYVLSNDLGTDSTYYGEFGMNSSVFSASTPSDFFSINNGIYFSGHDGDISIGSGNGFKTYLAWGTTGQSAHVINASGALGFSTNLGTTPALSGTTGFGTSGQALISAGNAAAPAWGVLGISGGGTGLSSNFVNGTIWQSVQTASFTAVVGNGYPINTTSSAITVTLPASPTAGKFVSLLDYAGTWATNSVTVNPNGANIQGISANGVLRVNREAITLVYIDPTQGWLPISAANEGTTGAIPIPFTASYVLIAGGGGGGSGIAGGGGAGGFISTTATFYPGTSYAITIGAGGAGGAGGTVSDGSKGANSSIASFTAAVGGGGGGALSNNSNGIGGSGGGNRNGTTNSGTSGQGNNGGAGVGSPTGSGGGGAGAVGSNATNTAGGNGGNGLATSISGSSITYAGGGGGAGYINLGYPGGSGGSGGGTAGTASGNASNCAANTGSGGGGGGYDNTGPYNYAGGNGGSGICIFSIPTSRYTGIYTGSPAISTNGSNTILTFTTSGSYTA